MKWSGKVSVVLLILSVAGVLSSCAGDTAGGTPDGFTGVLNETTSTPLNPVSTETSTVPEDAINETPVPTTTTSVMAPPVTTENNTAVEPEKTTELKIVGYITHWHISRLPDFNLEMLTHLIWQGVEVTSGSDASLRTAGNAPWQQIPQAVEAGHDAGTDVLVSLIGFWSTSDLNEVWRSPELRAELVNNLADLVLEYDLDGVDVDNENRCETELYTTFINELHEVLNPLGKIITIAGNPWKVCIDPETAKNIEFINLMTYDMANITGYPYHSTYEESVTALRLWEDAGIPAGKLLMGVPFYGRDGYGEGYEYRWIVDTYHPESDQNEVETDVQIIWWNGPNLVREKVGYVMEEGYGGVMVYEIGTDSPGRDSLLQVIYEELTSGALPELHVAGNP